jgi:hypothetical protein
VRVSKVKGLASESVASRRVAAIINTAAHVPDKGPIIIRKEQVAARNGQTEGCMNLPPLKIQIVDLILTKVDVRRQAGAFLREVCLPGLAAL